MQPPIDWTQSLVNACTWLTETATVQSDDEILEVHRQHHPLRYWPGAIWGEYTLANQLWGFFCPIWHTGQAIKALLGAYEVVSDPALLTSAKMSGGCLLKNQHQTGPDAGLLLAYENSPEVINSSAQMEALDGLFRLSEVTGEDRYQNAALLCLDWLANHAWQPEMRLFRDNFDPHARKWVRLDGWDAHGRPLLDDAVFLTGYHRNHDERFLQIALQTAERLLEEEDPPGNWVRYVPCNAEQQRIHPRHAYWWGRPMRLLYEHTGEQRYRDVFLRAARWYQNALRMDGGMFRHTWADFKTDSFGHATSGAAGAAIMLFEAAHDFGQDECRPMAKKALQFCASMQLNQAEDPNARYAILEKVLSPNGTDRCPYHLRDLGTIFYVQALSLILQKEPKFLNTP